MSAQDPITGEWQATLSEPIQMQDLTLMLMLEGKQVSGRAESKQGTYMLENGEFAKNRLTVFMPGPQGEVELSAQLQDGKLVASKQRCR